MRSPPKMTDDDDDDMFGPPRSHPMGFAPSRSRPMMISAKYRQKEERRKVLKISIGKLKKIEDPETSLCRSVLINNTLRMLQHEVKEEKLQKQQLNYPRCYDSDHLLNIKNEFMKNELKIIPFVENEHFSNIELSKSNVSEDKDFDQKLAEELKTVKDLTDEKSDQNSGENLDKAEMCSNSMSVDSSSYSKASVSPLSEQLTSRKRIMEEVDDCDVSDVLSQFYMPPTPRMLTCIDEEEDVNVVDDEPLPKRAKKDSPASSATVLIERSTPETCSASLKVDLNLHSNRQDLNVDYFLNNNLSHDSRPRVQSDETNSFSCARHASNMFNEFQNNVYRNLIASLET